MAKTRYVVLEEADHDAEGDWNVYSNDVEATSATGAIRAALNGEGNIGRRYVAVPQRSWKPQSVEVETQRRLKIG